MSEGHTQINERDSSSDSIVSTGLTWDPNSADTPSYVVLSAVADVTDSDLLELPPLNNAIDPEALDALFTSRSNPTVDRVSFEYVGHEVTVKGSGEVSVRPVSDA